MLKHRKKGPRGTLKGMIDVHCQVIDRTPSYVVIERNGESFFLEKKATIVVNERQVRIPKNLAIIEGIISAEELNPHLNTDSFLEPDWADPVSTPPLHLYPTHKK